MKNYFKKMSLLLTVASTIALTSSIGVFAADDYITGVSNLNNTTENSGVVGSKLLQPEKGWIRFNQDNSNITYSKIMYSSDSQWSQWSDDTIFTNSVGANLKFNFVGNKIRIISPVLESYSSNIEISIDGKAETFSEYFSGAGLNDSRLVFEKSNLSSGEHTVVITCKDNHWVHLDAIDINEGGELKPYDITINNTAKVGDKLLAPEAGWKRFNQNNSNIQYDGLWRTFRDTYELGDINATIKFNFIGNKIRIIANRYTDSNLNLEISIDGNKQTFSESSNAFEESILVFENRNLENKEHSVVITSKTIMPTNLDAIDINEGGKLKPYVDQAVTTTPAAVQATV